MKNYVITIARGLGSGGSHIAKQLSKDLQIPYYDTEILTMASNLSGISENFFFEANEKISRGQLTFASKEGAYHGNVYSPQDKRFLSNENLFAYQAKVILGLAMEGGQSCIIVGKASNYILRTFPNTLKVNVQAPIGTCISNIMERLMVDEKEAKKMIEQTDTYRSNYYKYYTGGDWINPKEYDISINTAAMSEAYSVELIKRILTERFPQSVQ